MHRHLPDIDVIVFLDVLIHVLLIDAMQKEVTAILRRMVGGIQDAAGGIQIVRNGGEYPSAPVSGSSGTFIDQIDKLAKSREFLERKVHKIPLCFLFCLAPTAQPERHRIIAA
ncbi:hypothetical protein RB25_23455 [Herbaspirillum rubrisubalbicans]|uniref:Uncharacterized protein n=1 Tax=Herbaspirillum rubrisubalbicans TaxID=80842 RepID=A0ABX9C548_9BURK|nr:hypothetical protein RB24_06045 [Herbaspirillum rubrisubalbicans]RAN43485.1 hypothetical protein RB25_23455 [Herbaspirillum rubrisubalbicans]